VDKDFDLFKIAFEASIEHHFNNRTLCGEWCASKKLIDRGESADHLHYRCRRTPSTTGFFLTCTIPRVRKILLKLLRIEIENYSHHHDNGNVSNRTSMDIDLFNTCL
jgi:hypothetical protein